MDFDEFLEKLQILYNMAHGIEQNSDDDLNSNYESKTLSELLESGMTLQEAKAYREKISTASKQKKKIHKASDSELIKKAKELKIYKSLFVVDECHNFFDMDNKVKVWWLTYHRHLYHDIYLITQNLSLVHPKYKPLAEAFYKAKSSSLTLNKKYFNYMYYTESRMTKDSFVETIKVPKRQEVFKLYKSGDVVESKNVIKRFIYIAIFFVFVLFALAYGYYKFSIEDRITKDSAFTSFSAPVQKSVSQSVNNGFIVESESEDKDYSDSMYMLFKCNEEMCSYKDLYIDIKLLTFATQNFNLNIINTRHVFSQVYISVSVDRSFLNFIKGGSDEVRQFKTDSIISTFGK
ncbi:zonular occludens toxin domain-containing protein [Sulfurimonas sp. SWIR-19]|uniref:zonular occludens toxin domain-containing protein n=1 Tax=Sulfurimonas sp. SWIR-19 TaxID=2878390 RepID=UPI001CF0F589|nr:zonular occludens toxin domain-containing protein [Sulfurimonas sp. SWIR-19]UCN00056.1 zonular occludens toxin domain-containing protein [Sulfurimonas sp. SWIR-19]